MKTLQRQVIGNPENNIVCYTCRNLEINPSTEISLSSVLILCSVQFTNALVTFIKGFNEGQFALLPLDLKI